MKQILQRTRRTIVTLGVIVALAGCSGSQDAKALLASAKEYLGKNDTRAAIIQLRNARQAAPNDGEIRYLLGRAYMESGDAVAAEIELRRAAELRYAGELVQPLIAQSMVAQAKYREALAEFANPPISDTKARADIHVTLAIASMQQGDMKQARAQLEQAFANDPKLPRAHVVRAQLAMLGNDAAEANAALDAALAAVPNDPEASVLKAQLLAAQNRNADAIALLERTAAAHPALLNIRQVLVEKLIVDKRIDRAAEVVESMRKDAANAYRTKLATAQLELAKRNFAKVRELTQELLAQSPDHLQTLQMSAIADFQLKNYALAEESLQKVLAKAPGATRSRNLLALTYMRTGRTSQAIELIEQALRRTPDDPALLRLAAEARLQTGNVAEATKLYERAGALDRSQNSVDELRLAQIRLASGDVARGIAELEQVSADDPSNIQADVTLYATHLRRRQYDKALAAVDAIEKKQPGKALNPELRGNVHMAARRLKEARSFYERALSIEPARLSAARSLAMIDLQEGSVQNARARYEALAKADPRNELPLVALAELLALSGAPEAEVRGALDRAIAANPSSPGARIALVSHFRRSNDNRGALEAARAAMTALPGDARMVEMYGTMLLASGDVAQARETFTRLTQITPQSAGPWLRVAEAHIAAKDYPAAIEAQRRALALQPDYVPAAVALATAHLLAGKPDDAVAEARRLQRERPKQAVGYALEAEVMAAQRKYAEALPPMREALSRQPLSSLASRNYALLVLAGRQPDANSYADRWVKEHPKDGTFLTQIGQQRQATKDAAGAMKAYRAALEVEPDNVIVLNNLAWLLNEQGNAEARDLAERAYNLAPLNANIVDTLGTVALTQGDIARAQALLRQATNLSPRDPRLRINLARALVKSGDKAGARRELERVVAGDARSPAKAEAEQMLREL